MSMTRRTSADVKEEKTIGSSVAPVARVGRRLQVAAQVLASLEAPVGEASPVLIVRGAAPVVRAVGEKLSVGRSASADWCIEEPMLSRLHFEITRDGSDSLLRDLKPHNGTRVNDAACTERRLANGDLIQAGRQTFLFLAGTDSVLAG